MFLIKKDKNNGIKKLVQNDRLLYSHSERALATEESHNSLCSLFLFDFDAKRKSRTEKEKHEWLNGSSYQGLCPRTPNHVIMRKQAEQSMKQSIQSDVVILNPAHHCHPELRILARVKHSETRPWEGCVEPADLPIIQETVSGSQKLRRFRNKFGMTINNSANSKKDNKNVKNLHYYLNTLLPKKKFAFTLAEVLITLGIIGIVAAMTIPTLMQKYYEKQTVSRLKETYSILTQALKLCGEENGYPEEWGLTGRNEESTAIVAEKVIPFLKINIDCGMKMEKSDKCFPNKIQRLNGEGGEQSILNNPKYYVSLLNGTSLAIESAEVEADMYLYFLVDTNGTAKPNTFGKDIFEFTYKPNLGLIPSGHPDNKWNSYKDFCHDLGDYGWGCAYYVINFGDMAYLHRAPKADPK